jgi:hypothetical protein
MTSLQRSFLAGMMTALGGGAAFGSTQFGTTLPSTVSNAASVSSDDQFIAQPFTFNSLFEIDSISVDVGGKAADPLALWITDAVGSSTTNADVLFQANSTFPNTNSFTATQVVTFSTDLVLHPGTTYFLVMSSSTTTIGKGWAYGDTVLDNSALGALSPFEVSNAITTDDAFAPGSTFGPTAPGDDVDFQFAGEAVPEPTTWLICGTGLTLLAAVRIRRLA